MTDTPDYKSMSDQQLQQTIRQLNMSAQHQGAPTAQHLQTYTQNLQKWSASPAPSSKPLQQASAKPSRSSKPARASQPANVAPAAQTYSVPMYQQHPQQVLHPSHPNPPRPPLATTPQAMQTTYASRLRTGATLLMQPILASTSATNLRATRRGGAVNYADPGSGDEFPDAGAIDSEDSDFVASGGLRTSLRATRTKTGPAMSMYSVNVAARSSTPQQPMLDKAELDQSYLGMIPPDRFIKPKIAAPTQHRYFSQDDLEAQASKPAILIPIRVELETDTHRIRDCFAWNINERLITPESFARIFCTDLDLPMVPWSEMVANQIRAQIEDHEGVASMYLTLDDSMDVEEEAQEAEDMNPEARVMLSIDVQIGNYHLVDVIEWDLLSPLTPEEFSKTLCWELGLSGEAIPLVSHALHEELIKHKKDAIEWGVIGGDKEAEDLSTLPKDKSGLGLLKDKTGLGLGWGSGRGPKALRSVWRDWAEAEEFVTRFEVLTQEEVERREVERERASRRLRRETSKFQSSARSRRR